MPSKITDLTDLPDPSLVDLLPVVDDPAGTPITKKLTISSLLTLLRQSIHDVGDVVLTLVNVNPSARYGGTWALISQGRALVGVDAGDPDFDAAEKVSGSKTHTLSTAEMPSHTHVQNSHNHTQDAHTHLQNAHNHVENVASTATGALVGSSPDASTNTSVASGYSTANTTAVNQNATATNQAATATNQNTGGGAAHNNVQPSFAVYMWKRTA